MMKNLLLISALIFFNLLTAQYNINWKEAPLNQIPIPYKLEHFNLKGPLKDLTGGRDLHFNNKGNLTEANALVSFRFTYDADNNPLTYSSWFINESKSIFQLKLDNKGRIKEKNGENNSVFTYDSRGNWTGTVDQKGKREDFSRIFTYDTKNRLIKSEFFNSSILWTNHFTYAKDGDFLVITDSYENFKDPSKNFQRKNYYKNGFNYGSVKNDNFKFDQYGNPTVELDAKGNVFRTNETQYVYYTESTQNQIGSKNATNPTETSIKKDPYCLEGNCKDGFGTYQYSNGKYTGFFTNLKKEGFGFYKWNSGDLYSGSWKDDKMTGFGLFTRKDGTYMEGNFDDAKMKGLGVKHLGNKKFEYGFYSNDKLIRNYELTANNLTTGCVQGNCKNGFGYYFFEDGSSFQGFFENSKMLQGTWTNKIGDKYFGKFGFQNHFEGYGHLTYKNGDNYFGEYSNSKRNGRGFFLNAAKNTTQIGEWKDDVLVKPN